MNPRFAACVPLGPDHSFETFDCGNESLNDWLRSRSQRNERDRATRTYVVCLRGTDRVVGYHSLAAGAIAHEEVSGSFRRNMPDPIPIIVLARLAVDQSQQGKGLGQSLLRDSMWRALQASQVIGARALVVHAINDDARKFYEKADFRQSPVNPLTLMQKLVVIQKYFDET